MASIGAAVAVNKAGLLFTVNPLAGIAGMAVTAAAGILDQRLLYAKILGDSDQVRPPRLLELPQMSVSPGSPRIWAIGRRVRVPVHVMFQSNKTREQQIGGAKGGVASSIKRIFADVALALNDRPTHRLAQLIGSGKLLVFTTRNLVLVNTDQMTLAVLSGTQIRLTMASTAEPDFNDKFAVNDRVRLDGWIVTAGTSVNFPTGGYWKVNAVTAHAGATASTITLDAYTGQSTTSLVATAGTTASPASVTRVDDAYLDHAMTGQGAPGGITNQFNITIAGANQEMFERAFQVKDRIRMKGWTASSVDDREFEVHAMGATGSSFLVVLKVVSGTVASGSYTAGSSTNAARIEFWLPNTYASQFFAADPSLSYYRGTETQTADSIIAQTETTGSIPGFRGLAYQVLEDFEISQFGNQVPLMEAIIEPDLGMTWGQAITAICERSEMSLDEVDVTGVSVLPFEGYYVRGAVSGLTALQPLLVAGQIATQERDGVLCFFDIENADVVQVENGAEFSDLGATAGRDTPLQVDKIQHGQLDEADLPTSIGLRHQDPENVYADGFQHFGQRQPTRRPHENRQEIDLASLVLTRKQARNLATTVMRRTWVNAHTVEMSLPVAYLELLENDVITVTDDDGNDVTARIIRREDGGNFLVNILAVREHLDLEVSGSPVQGAGNTNPPSMPNPASLRLAFMDIAPLLNDHAQTPGLYVAACAEPGGHWAGAQVYESRDGGTEYTLAGTLSVETMIGVTTSSLAAGTLGETTAGGPFWDNTSTVDIEIAAPGLFGLSNRTAAQVLAGDNWVLIGDEILGFQTVTEPVEGTFRLSNLLRGIRGTYNSATASKAAGQQLVYLSYFMASGIFLDAGQVSLPATRHYKVVPTGATLADVDATAVSVQGWNARPFPVREFECTVDGTSFDATFTFAHWSRLIYPVGSIGPFELDEEFEEYVLRIYDPTATTLRRQKTVSARNTGSPTLRPDRRSFLYTAAEQTVDGYSPAADETFHVEIEQGGTFGSGQTWRREVPT